MYKLKFSKKGIKKMAELEDKHLQTGVLAAGGLVETDKPSKKRKKGKSK